MSAPAAGCSGDAPGMLPESRASRTRIPRRPAGTGAAGPAPPPSPRTPGRPQLPPAARPGLPRSPPGGAAGCPHLVPGWPRGRAGWRRRGRSAAPAGHGPAPAPGTGGRGGGGARPSLPRSLPRPCGGCGAPGWPRPGEGQRCGAPGQAGSREPRSSTQPTWQRGKGRAQPRSGRADKCSSCRLSAALWMDQAHCCRDPAALVLSNTTAQVPAHVRGYTFTRARPRMEHCLFSTLTLGRVLVSQGLLSPSTYLYVDSKLLSPRVFFPNSPTKQG